MGMKFDGACPRSFEVSAQEIKEAYDRADPALKKALQHAKDNIAAYHEKQIRQGL
jgi:histidinol dehydrogenase